MANNGIYYSSGNSLNFTTNSTTWATLTSGGTFDMNAVSATTYYNLPPATFTGGTVSGETTFTSGLTVNYIDFDTTPNVPAPTGGTVYFDSNENALSYKPITLNNDVTVNLGQESLIRFYNDLGFQINNGQALHITGATSGTPTVSLAVGTGGNEVQFQVSGIATHDIPDSTYGFMTTFGVVRDINLTAFTVGQQVYLSQTTPGGFDSYSNLSFTGRTCELGHVLDNSSLGKLQVTILNEIEGTIITTQENNILAANNSSTGVFQFSGLSITAPSATTFNVGAVEGWIIDNTTSPANPTIQLIIYSGSTGNTALYVSSATETYILLTSGLTLIQQTTFPTPQQRRQNLYLGKFGHGNRQFLINTFNEPDSALSPVSQLRDMFTPVKLVNDGVIPSANGANLNINTSAGILYGLGIGYVTNKLNPNSLTVGGQSPATFQYRTQTGGTATNTTTIEPGFWDVNGVRTAISGTKATNQRIYLLQNGQIRVQYGQTEYNQLAAAIAALQNETFVTFPNFRDNGILIGVLSILSSCTNLTDTSKAQFFSVSKFGELIGAAGGTSTTTLQQAYNNSSDPEITINSTLDGLSIKNGTGNADNTTQLLQGENTAGTVTSFIRADGLFSGSSVSTPGFTANTNGLTANTISATTYQNLPQSVSGTGNVNYVPKWSTSDSLTDSLIQDDGTQVNIGGTQYLGSRFSVDGPVGVNGAQIQFKNTSIGITDSDLTSWGSTSGEIAIGIGGPLLSSTGYDNIAVGNQSMSANTSGYGNIGIGKGVLGNNTTGYHNVAVGEESLYSNTGQRRNVAIGYQAGYSTTDGFSVFIGNQAGYYETGGGKLYIANSTTPLIYGEFNNNIVGIIGTLTATTYNNLPVSAVTSGNGISASTSNGTVTVTNTDLGSSQNIFKNIQITGTTQFSAGSNSSNLNFSGVNINIFSASSNTLVFSAGTGGGGGGTVTSVALSAGTSGTDVNISNSAITTSGTITINIPDASATARGLVTANNQTFAGRKNFTSAPIFSSLSGSCILATDSSKNVQALSTNTYPDLAELSYVKGVDSDIQVQLNNKFNTNGGTISGNLTVTGTTTSAIISATTYQNLPVSAVTNGTGISTSTTNGVTTVTNTDLGSSQNIFKNIQIAGVSQFSAGSNSSNLNFSGINITITSAATNTLVFSAGTGGAGAVSSVTAGSGLSGNSTTGAITLVNTQVQGITGITASSGISASTSNNVVTLTNTGVTGITAGNNITIDQSTGNVTINSIGGVSFGNVYTTANNFNFL